VFVSTTKRQEVDQRDVKFEDNHNSLTVQLDVLRPDRNVDNTCRPENQFLLMAARTISGLRPSWYSPFDADYGAMWTPQSFVSTVSISCRLNVVYLLWFAADLDVQSDRQAVQQLNNLNIISHTTSCANKCADRIRMVEFEHNCSGVTSKGSRT